MKIKLIFLSSLLIILTFSGLFSDIQQDQVKNKPLAVLLSVVSPGIGQIYTGDYEKGFFIWGASSILSFAFLINVSDVDFSTVGFAPIQFKLKNKIDNDRLFWVISIGTTYSILYLYNIVDVSLDKNSNISLDFKDDALNVCYSYKF